MVILPILYWVGYAEVGRAMTFITLAGVFFSGFLKDAVCLPRPLPPVRRLTMSSTTHHLEYGFPSTHTTNAVGVTLYLWSILASYDGPWSSLAWYAAGLYGFSVSFGRIYCGMHGIVDVFAGGLLGTALWAFWATYWDIVDTWVMTNGWIGN